MAARLISTTEPGAAARTAKNAPTAPGLPNQPGNDSKGSTPMVGNATPASISPLADTAELRRVALRQLRFGRNVMASWLAAIAQDATRRVGCDFFDLDGRLEDPAYRAAVELYGELNVAITGLACHAREIEAGDLS